MKHLRQHLSIAVFVVISAAMVSIAVADTKSSCETNSRDRLPVYIAMIGIMVALFKDSLWRWSRMPLLLPDYVDDGACNRYVSEHERYLRLRLTNVGIESAEGCRGFLLNVEFVTNTGLQPTGYLDTLPLRWSSMVDQGNRTLQAQVPFYLDLISVATGHSPILHVETPPGQGEVFKNPGRYMLTVAISSENATPARLILAFDWHGDFRTAKLSVMSRS